LRRKREEIQEDSESILEREEKDEKI